MSFENRLAALEGSNHLSALKNIARGIEKESLRVEVSGHLAKTKHPSALGSALTHPSITTDYSEALLEFITAPSASIDQVLNELEEIHSYTYQHINDSRYISIPLQNTRANAGFAFIAFLATVASTHDSNISQGAPMYRNTHAFVTNPLQN